MPDGVLLRRGTGAAARRSKQALRTVIWLLIARALYALLRRRRSSKIPLSLTSEQRPFLAFSGSGLLLGYYHGIVTYIRDHFQVDNLQLSGISGGCSTIFALAMGLDLYQVLVLGLHWKKKYVQEGVYLTAFEKMLEYACSSFAQIGVTDHDVAQMSARQQCFIGVTQCFPPGHRCIGVPSTVRDLSALWISSMSVMPFLRTPGVYKGNYYVDGGFSAMYSVPDGQPWDDVIKVTCMPWWGTLGPPAMGFADIQPSRLMAAEVLYLFPWAHQRTLIKRGYDDARLRHDHLVSRGMRPLPSAPVTPWSEWERLFAELDEDHLPPLSATASTVVATEAEKRHLELLRTYSATDLHDALQGPRMRRLSSPGSVRGSQSDANVADLCSAAGGRRVGAA